MTELAGKVAIVTGGSAGIGLGIAAGLVREGAHVVIADIDDAAGQNALDALGPNASYWHTDVADQQQLRDLVDHVASTHGRLDIMINNAGIGAPPINLEDLTYEQWKAAVDTNLTGPFLCTQHAFRIMKNQNPRGGRIINNGSISAHAPRPNSAPYTSTKHAITGLTKATSLDGRKYDIACGQIDIGNAHTPMTGRMLNGVPQPDGSIRPEPVMDVDNVGKTILFMASLPLDANVQFVTVMATKMPFIGRG